MIWMSKKSRLNVEPSLEDLDSWWGKMDVHTKNWIRNISKNTINAGKESNVVQSLDDYVGKRKEFLKELPKTLIDDWTRKYYVIRNSLYPCCLPYS